MIALNVCPICKFIFTSLNYRKQAIIPSTTTGCETYTTNIVCSCGAVLWNDLLIVSRPEVKPITNTREEIKDGRTRTNTGN